MNNRLKGVKRLLGITCLDEYIIGKFLVSFFFGLIIFISIIFIFDISEKIDDFLRSPVSVQYIISNYYVSFIFFYASLLSPLIVFLAVIFFTAKMANNTEIIPILSSGISFNRFLYPYFLTALFLALLSFVFNAFIIPPFTKKKIDFENKYVRSSFNVNRSHNYHFKLDDHTYAYLETFDPNTNVGYNFSLEEFKDKRLTYKLMARHLIWNPMQEEWKADHYSVRSIDGLHETMERGGEKVLILSLKPEDFIKIDNDRGALTLPQLNEKIEQEILRGTGEMARYAMDRWRIFLTPLCILILTFMGVSLSSKKVRGGVGLSLGIGIACSYLYIIFIQFSVIFSVKGGLSPTIASFIPHVIFGIVTFFLYKNAVK